jgi:site-specific recombinase XerD
MIQPLSLCAAAKYPHKGYKKSWDSDDSYLRNHVLPKFAHCHLDEVTQQAVIELHHSMRATGYAPATANRVIILMRYMYNLAKKWKIPGGEVNPTHGIDLFEVNNARERFLTAEEAQRLVRTVQGSENTHCNTSSRSCCFWAVGNGNCWRRSGMTLIWNVAAGGFQ